MKFLIRQPLQQNTNTILGLTFLFTLSEITFINYKRILHTIQEFLNRKELNKSNADRFAFTREIITLMNNP